MSGSCYGQQSLTQECASTAKWMHCKIHRETLVAQELSPEFGGTLEVVTKVINFIKTRPSKSRAFQKLCAKMNAENRSLLFFVRSSGFHLDNPFNESASWSMNFKLYLLQENNNLSDYLVEKEFLLKLAYLCDIFAKLNELNIPM